MIADRLKNLQNTEARVQEQLQKKTSSAGTSSKNLFQGSSFAPFLGMGRGKTPNRGPAALAASALNQSLTANMNSTNITTQEPSFSMQSPIEEGQPKTNMTHTLTSVWSKDPPKIRTGYYYNQDPTFKPNIIGNQSSQSQYQVTIPIQRQSAYQQEEYKDDELIELPEAPQMKALNKGMQRMLGGEQTSEDQLAEFLMWKQGRDFVSRVNQQPRTGFEDVPSESNRDVFKATRSMFSGKMKSKLDFYKILQKEGQVYLPPFDECPISFLKDMVMGKKKYFTNNQIMIIDVPFFEELSAKSLFDQIKKVPIFLLYLPDLDNAKRPPNRKYMYNIVNTVDPEFFPHNIREGYRLRKERFENQGNEEFEVDRNLFELIKGSNQIIHKRGRVLGYLGGEDKKRKLQAADFEEDEAMRDEGPEAKRIRHKYARAIEIDDSLINKLTQEYERAYFKPSQPDAHQSKRRL